MSAKDTVRCNKTVIQRTLSADRRLILNKVSEEKLITWHEYNNLKSIDKEDEEGHVIELVDKIINKGEDTCRAFLTLLQTDEDIKVTYPELKNIQLNDTSLLPKPVQVTSPDDLSNAVALRNKSQQQTKNTTAKEKTQQQKRKHNGKSENTMAKEKTQQQKRKHNNKQEKTMAKEKTQQKKRKLNGKSENTTANQKTQQQKRKLNGKRENSTANQKTQRQIRKLNSKRENSTAKEKTQRQIRKHNGKRENTTTKEKTQRQKRKHNDKLIIAP